MGKAPSGSLTLSPTVLVPGLSILRPSIALFRSLSPTFECSFPQTVAPAFSQSHQHGASAVQVARHASRIVWPVPFLLSLSPLAFPSRTPLPLPAPEM